MTYIVFPDGHNVLLRYSRAAHAFNVGDGHVAHDFAGGIAHGAVPVQGYQGIVVKRVGAHVLLDQDAITEDCAATPRAECLDIAHGEDGH